MMQDPTICGEVGTIDTACHNIAKVISILAGVGARHFLVPNTPDIRLIPETRALALLDPNCHVDALDSCAVVQLASALTKEFNKCLESQLQSLEAVSHRIEITRLDVFTLLDEVVADAATPVQKCGFTKVTDGCLDGDPLSFTQTQVCDSGGFISEVPVASGYLFFDNQHPTVAGHTLLAEVAGKAISGLPALPACLVTPQLTVVPAPSFDEAFERMRGTPTLLGW
jgi:phospholipase/lecithinase/hemolysin